MSTAHQGLLVAALTAVAQLPPLTLSRRLLVEVPFLLFVPALPVLDGPPRLAVLGQLATGVLAATTPLPEIITGLERLRGASPRWLWQVRDVTAGLGALAVPALTAIGPVPG